jgi:shikimate dehydrogenase
MCAYKPWAIKIATKIVDYNDYLIHRDLQVWMNIFCRSTKFCGSTKNIVLGMGDKAHYSRITSPMRNALTYTFLPGTEAAAPGQLPLSFYLLLPQVSRPALYGIIGGEQVVHSLSPLIHNLLFQQHGVDAIYSCFPTDDFKGTMNILEKLGIAGLSVTAPFKHDAFAFADDVDPIGKKLRTVNTLIFQGVRTKAFNTDVIGVERGYPLLKSAKSIAILGAGGVVPAVIEGIRRINPETFITVFARDPKKAAKELHGSEASIQPISKSKNCIADVVICAVSQDIVLPLPKHAKKSVAIDLRYGKETMFMKSAAAKGFRVYDGLPMLIHQALAQFERFTNRSIELTSDLIAEILYLSTN